MLNKLLSLFSLVISISSCNMPDKSESSEIQDYLGKLTSKDFSGVVLVAKEDSIIWHKAYGYANMEHEAENQLNTKFNIASITKMITAVGILKLYDSGKLSLETSIGKYLPDYPNEEVKNKVTIHQLLTHTSGLNNFYQVNFLETDKLKYNTTDDFLPLFADNALLSEPGEKYHYSASGFVVLGLIIEKVSGQNYYDYIREKIFEPAGMGNSMELAIDSVVTNKADGYTTFFGDSPNLKKNDYYLAKASPGGFHYSTAVDLFNFMKALRNGELLKKETFKLMSEPKVKGYNTYLGYGMDVDLRYDQLILGHSGGWYGVRAELMDFTKDGYTVVILSNIDDNGKTGASMVKDFFVELISSK